jgi:serine protease Do
MDVSDSDRFRRLFRAAGVTAGLLGLAGCSDGTELDPSQDPTQVRTQDDVDRTPRSTGTASPVTGTPGPSSADLGCDTGRANPGEVRNQIEQLEFELSFAREEWAEQFGRRGQLPGGFEDAALEAARTVGSRVRESVVPLELPSGQATGWFVDDRHVMTNAHNVFGRTSATAWTVDGSSFDVEVVELVENLFPDVALLRADSAGTPLPLGSASSLEPGDTVVQVGHPGEVGNWLITVGRHMHSMGLEDGADSPPDGYATVPELTISTPGAQGNSGSPLVNLDGEVVGMTHGGTDQNPLPHDGPPEPSEPVVYDWPLRWKMWSLHVPVETVIEHYEDWR